MRRVYPAYGLTIARHLARGQQPMAIGAMLSTRWQEFRHVPRLAVHPDEWALARWEFGFLHDQHVVAIFGDGAGNRAFGEFLCEVMYAGPRLLWVVSGAGAWLEKAGDPHAIADYARQLGADESLVAAAVPPYVQAQLRALDEDRRYFARGKVRRLHLDEVERLFGDPFLELEDRAA